MRLLNSYGYLLFLQIPKNILIKLFIVQIMAKDHKTSVAIRPFVCGGLASVISSFCMHPLDLTVYRINSPSIVAEESASGFGVLKMIAKDEGVRGFFSGVSTSIARHGLYGCLKIGLHDHISSYLRNKNGDQPIPFYQKVLAAMGSGAAAAIFGNPFDLALLRTLTDQCQPASERLNYRSPFHAIYHIGKTEGFRSLWRGCTPMVLSTMSMNVGMLAIYDEVKDVLSPFMGTRVTTNLLASAVSSLMCCYTALPFDMIKTRMMNMNLDPESKKYPYRNFFDCAVKLVKKGGVFSLWRGLSVYYARIAPYSMITLLTKDTINAVYDNTFCM